MSNSWLTDLKLALGSFITEEQSRALGQFLRPASDREGLRKLIDPVVAVVAGSALITASGLGFAAFGVLIASAFVIYWLLTHVFGISVELNPEMFRQFTPPVAN